MLIVGMGALTRPDGAQVLAHARALAEATGMVADGWNGFNVLHTAAGRVGGLDLGFVPGEGGRDTAAICAGAGSGAIRLLYLLGADELRLARPEGCFVVYQGHHGDAGARIADVILPGAAYTEKHGTYVNLEGRPQRAYPATAPLGEAREGLAHPSCSLCPSRQTACLRYAGRAARPDGRTRPGLGRNWRGQPGAVGRFRHSWRPGRGTLRKPRRRFLPDRSDHPRLGHHGRLQRGVRLPLWRGLPAMAEPGVWSTYFYPLFLTIGYILAIVLPLLLILAFITYFERKVWAAIQLRKGPNVVGPFGLLQPVADGIKCLFKETIVPAGANRMLFVLAPMVTFSLGLIGWAVIPFDKHLVLADLNVGLLYLFAVSSLGVYGIIIAGWASNSKYAFLGALRSAAQMVSYEVSIGFVLVTVLLCVGSLNLNDIVEAQRGLWFFIPLFPMFVIYVVSALAETNRTPFDLPEAEGELVAGYQVEYSSMTWLLFMMGEYANIVLLSGLSVILFLGGWLPPFHVEPLMAVPGVVWFLLKTAVVVFFFTWTRATLPRYRYDQLMRLGWKVFLPASLAMVVIVAGALHAFDWLPR